MLKNPTLSILKELKYYVYAYYDNEGKIFYIGKGVGTRALSHWKNLDKNNRQEGMKKILRKIKNSGNEPKILILRHGLEEEEAKLLESVLISTLRSLRNVELANIKSGKDSKKNLIALQDLTKNFAIGEASFNTQGCKNCVCVHVKKSYIPGKTSASELYDDTRAAWRIGKNRNVDKIKYVMPIYNGIILEVYEVATWLPAGSTMRARDFEKISEDEQKKSSNPRPRLEFVGRIADEKLRKKYNGKFYTIRSQNFSYCSI